MLKNLFKIGCVVMAVGFLSTAAWSSDNANMSPNDLFILADGGNGPGDGTGNGGVGPGDGTGYGPGPAPNSGDGISDGSGFDPSPLSLGPKGK